MPEMTYSISSKKRSGYPEICTINVHGTQEKKQENGIPPEFEDEGLIEELKVFLEKNGIYPLSSNSANGQEVTIQRPGIFFGTFAEEDARRVIFWLHEQDIEPEKGD